MAGAKVLIKGMTKDNVSLVRQLAVQQGGSVVGSVRQTKQGYNMTTDFYCWMRAGDFIATVYRRKLVDEAIMKEDY